MKWLPGYKDHRGRPQKHAHRRNNEFCLCPVDINAVAKKMGWKITPRDGDGMDIIVEIA